MTARCGMRDQLEHWARQGSDVACSEHLLTHSQHCESCGAFVQHVLSLRELYRSAPVPSLDEEQSAALRHRLIAEARRQRDEVPDQRVFGARWHWAVALSAIAAVVLLAAFGLGHKPRNAKPAGSGSLAEVTLVDTAIGHTRQLGPNEVYELVQGIAVFRVDQLRSGQRYRVMIGDDQVEVRGTRFQLQALQRRLHSVRVFEGRVEVTAGGTHRILEAGQNWAEELPRPQESTEESPLQVPLTTAAMAASSPRTLPTVQAAVSSSTPQSESSLFDTAFSAALGRLRSGDAAGAANDFNALLSSPNADSGRRADVLYWSGVAHHRSGNDAAAERQLRKLVSQQPNSWHGPEAALLLGEILISKGLRQQARPWLLKAAGSSRASTSAKARQLLGE